MFAPETRACRAPVALEVPDGYAVGWERGDGVYRLKLYDLRVAHLSLSQPPHAFIDADSLDGAQQMLDGLLHG